MNGSLPRHPLILFLPYFLLGLIIGKFLPNLLSCFLTLGCLCLCLRFLWRQNVIIGVSILFLAAFWQAHYFAPPKGPWHIYTYVNKQLTFEGEVAQVKNGPNKTQIILQNIKPLNSSHILKGKLRLSIYNPLREFHLGDVLKIRANMSPIRSFGNPGQMDSASYWHSKGIWVQVYVSGKNVIWVTHKDISFPKKILELWRNKIRNFLFLSLHQPSLGVYQALLLGEKDNLLPQVKEAFTHTGTSHLLAVSGLHLGMVMGMFFGLFWFILSRFEWALLHFQLKKWIAFMALIPTLAYALLAHFSPATARSFIMLILFWWLYFSPRLKSTWFFLIFAGWVLLLFYPPLLFRLSFQFSFLALAGILVLTPHLYNFFTERLFKLQISSPFLKKIKHYLILALSTSTAAYITTLPLSLHYFSGISLISPFVNLLAIPMVGFLILPLGLLSIFWLPLSEGVAKLLLLLGQKALLFLISLLQQIIKIPAAFVYTPILNWMEVLTLYLILLSLLYSNFLKRRFSYLPHLILLGGICFFSLDFYMVKTQSELRISFYDIGRGNCILFEFPKGKKMFIGGGSRSPFDITKNIVAPALWSEKIMQIDYLVLPLARYNYVNGLSFMAHHFNPKQVWTVAEHLYFPKYWELFYFCRQKHIPLITPEHLPQVQSIDGVILRRISPKLDFLCVYGRHKFLFPFGKIRPSDLPQKVNVLLAPNYLLNTKAHFVVFSNKRIMQSKSGQFYRQSGAKILCPSLNGAIRFISNKINLKVKIFHPQTNRWKRQRF